MEIVPRRLVEEPDIALIPRAAPVVVVPLLPAVEDRLVLALIVGAAEREGVSWPRSRTSTTCRRRPECALQRVQLRAAHADVARALGDREDVGAGVVQERLETARRDCRSGSGGACPGACPSASWRSRRCMADRVKVMSASWPPSTRSTSASTVASPHSSRWLPRTHRSPGLLTGCSGGSRTSSSSSVSQPRHRRSPAAAPAPPRRSRSGRGRSARPGARPAPAASSASSQPAFSASWLSAIRYARFCASLRCSSRITGTSVQPELAGRQQPAMPGDDPALAVDQHRVGPAELDHRGRDLVHLRVAVRARVALVRAQAVDRPAARSGRRARPAAQWCERWQGSHA